MVSFDSDHSGGDDASLSFKVSFSLLFSLAVFAVALCSGRTGKSGFCDSANSWGCGLQKSI